MVDLRDAGPASASTPRPPAQRTGAHHLYLELASFTSAYLEHQDLEERVVMPDLDTAIGVEAVAEIHVAIIASIPPEVMAQSLALMLPAMNIDDRTELLGGMQAGAPPEVFAGVWGLAGPCSARDHRRSAPASASAEPHRSPCPACPAPVPGVRSGAQQLLRPAWDGRSPPAASLRARAQKRRRDGPCGPSLCYSWCGWISRRRPSRPTRTCWKRSCRGRSRRRCRPRR